jgi:hypothetical protein
MTDETIYRYPDGTRQRIGASLDDVPVANATERTAPRVVEQAPGVFTFVDNRTVPVDRTLLVALLDAWQVYEEARYGGDQPEGPAYWAHQREVAWDGLYEALSAFAAEVQL